MAENKAELDTLGNRYLELGRFSGVILIGKGASIIYNSSFGFSDYETEKVFSEKTAFKIGKVSELVTAAIVRKMAKEDKFQLTDKVSQYILEINSDYTINDLLDHNTDFPKLEFLKENYPEIPYSTIEYTQLALQSTETSESSELEYNILGLLIERVSTMSFEENLQKYALELGLENTYFDMPHAETAVGYLYHNYRGNGLELQESPVADPKIAFSSDGLKSTAKDLLKIVVSTPEKEIDIFGYLENDGFSYSIERNPETDITIIILSNRRHPVAGEITNSVRAILNGAEYRLPLQREAFDIDKNLLSEYSGSYVLNSDMTLEVLDENDSLFVLMGPNKIHIIPQSPNQFFMSQRDASLRFLRDANQVVNAVELLDGFMEGNIIQRER